MPKALRIVVALCITTLLFAALAVLATGVRGPKVSAAQGNAVYTLRVYGRANQGAGALVTHTIIPFGVLTSTAQDSQTKLCPEDAPYTDTAPIFNPQFWQAPVNDSITWNPLWMSEFETYDENHAHGLYNQIFAGTRNATEKVWFRMWYEPWHWDKDLNANGLLDVHPQSQVPYTDALHDEWYPAIMQEFTYMLMEPKLLVDKPEPLAGPVGQTRFVFPVGMRKADLFTSGNQVDATSANARYGYGLTSLDGDFDGVPDIVHVESELTLFAKTRIAADFDGDGIIDPFDSDAKELSGDELAVLRLETKGLTVNQAVQFLDHLVIVKAVFDNSAMLEIWYTGDLTPVRLGTMTLFIGDMLLSGRNGPGEAIRAVDNGGLGTNMCDFPTGPFFAYLESIDRAEYKARLMVGRAIGATWSGMEDKPGFRPDLKPGDPWFLKRFYVDGHEYNVVAIKADPGITSTIPHTCTLDADGNKVIDAALWPPPMDPTKFKFITIRTPVPKRGEYDDPQVGQLIEQHSVRLQPYFAADYLSVMPPYNYEHYIILDVHPLTAWTCAEEGVDYFGKLVGPVPPILQKNGPFPYIGVGLHSPYSDLRQMTLLYIDEGNNWQFLGELKEKYGITDTSGITDAMQFWYVEQFHTLPWEYTEFVLPDLSPIYTGNKADLYLLTSAFLARQSEALLWTQDVPTQTTKYYNLRWDSQALCWARHTTLTNTNTMTSTMPLTWKPRAKFWFDPAEGGKKYKNDQGLRLYGFGAEGPGVMVTDVVTTTSPVTILVEVRPYTDTWAPFDPQLPQAPPKDSLTFNPAYMDKFYNSGESLVSLYGQISIREHDAREKVFLRMWYEPEYLDKILRVDTHAPYTPTEVYTFPALMQEFTYMYVDVATDKPAHGQPGSSTFAFPMATAAGQLPKPEGGLLPTNLLPSFGYGLTTFDANFDGQHDIVHIHSERTLAALTGITATFDGDNVLDTLDTDGLPLSGDELVVFALEDMLLRRGESLQFLDYMVTLDNVPSADRVDLKFWYTGGGLHPVAGGQYSLHPDAIGTQSLQVHEMAIVNKSAIRVLSSAMTTGNFGSTDGPWFVFVKAVNSADRTASLVVGRALGATHSAIDNGLGDHDMEIGDPWYLKRFFVDGHEYNVVAVCTERVTKVHPTDEGFELKYITVRTPVPKVNFINHQDSQKLEGYHLGTVFGVDTSIVSVMPPFNFEHTCVEDIQALPEKAVPSGETSATFVFGDERFRDEDCRGVFLKDKPPYEIRIVDENREPQFFGELKEKYGISVTSGVTQEVWLTEQWHTMPDQYTELRLPPNQKYLVTSSWWSEKSRVYYYGCNPPAYYNQNQLHGWNPAIPLTNTIVTGTGQVFFSASVTVPLRFKFLYDPADSKDVYVNTWQPPPPPTPTPTPTRTPTPLPGPMGAISGIVRLQGRTNHSGAQVSVGSLSTTTDSNGQFTLSGVPVGTHTVIADMMGYLSAQKPDVVVNAGTTTVLPTVQLLGGDADDDGDVDLFDLVFISWRYGNTIPPADPRADINGNGIVDIFDLVMAGLNYGKTAPHTWVAPSMPDAHIAEVANLRVSPAHLFAQVGKLATVTLELENVSNLYGADVQLTFDPNLLQVVDADPATPGVQVTPGQFLWTDEPMQRIVGRNEVDNEQGVVHYAISLVSPAPTVNGSGTLCTITFQPKALGETALDIIYAELVDVNTNLVPVLWEHGMVHIGPLQMPYQLYLPLIIKAGEQR